MEELIRNITFCIAAAWILGVAAQWLKQPVILAYLLGGFIVGPHGMGWVHEQKSIEIISELGLIFLLFLIGLEIDLKKIARAGRVITWSAGSQILGGCVLAFALFRALGFPAGSQGWDAIYLAVAAAMSSTVIIVKVLYEKRELDTLPGRITLGILVIQDLFAILFLAIQPSLDHFKVTVLLESLLRVGVLVAVAVAVSLYLPSAALAFAYANSLNLGTGFVITFIAPKSRVNRPVC